MTGIRVAGEARRAPVATTVADSVRRNSTALLRRLVIGVRVAGEARRAPVTTTVADSVRRNSTHFTDCLAAQQYPLQLNFPRTRRPPSGSDP